MNVAPNVAALRSRKASEHNEVQKILRWHAAARILSSQTSVASSELFSASGSASFASPEAFSSPLEDVVEGSFFEAASSSRFAVSVAAPFALDSSWPVPSDDASSFACSPDPASPDEVSSAAPSLLSAKSSASAPLDASFEAPPEVPLLVASLKPEPPATESSATPFVELSPFEAPLFADPLFEELPPFRPRYRHQQ